MILSTVRRNRASIPALGPICALAQKRSSHCVGAKVLSLEKDEKNDLQITKVDAAIIANVLSHLVRLTPEQELLRLIVHWIRSG